MLHPSNRHIAFLAVACGGFVAACTTPVPKDPSTPSVAAGPETCTRNQIDIRFSPMYSAFDGIHTFQVPAVVDAVQPGSVTWGISNPAVANLQPASGGVMITMQKPGNAIIVATSGSLCGLASILISPASPDEWMMGSLRYNNGVVLGAAGEGLVAGGNADGGVAIEAACTNCHGDTATNGPFTTVSHTPQQTAGFSDDQLIGIFTEGSLPPLAYFDDSIVSRQQWATFHRWSMTPAQARGMVVYLRSLVPQPQRGARADFGRRPDAGPTLRRDGGYPDGSSFRADGR